MITSAGELRPERLDMVRALEESLLSFYGSMQEKGIRPEIHMPESSVYRELDASALGRIFSNIISNALNKEAESPDKHWTFSFFSAGDERIELPPKVLETPIIPFDQSPVRSTDLPDIYITQRYALSII